MTRILFRLAFILSGASLLLSAADAAASHRNLFGIREKVKVTTVTTQTVRGEVRLFGIVIKPVRAAVRVATAPVRVLRGITGGGCIGTVTHVRAQAAPAGCSGWTGPGWVVPSKVVPMPLPPKR